MVDFSQLLNRPAGQAKKPPALPGGFYTGKVKQFECGDKNKNNTPYVRFHLATTGWPDSVGDEDRQGIDLSKKQLSRDFFLTEDALWRLDEFLRSCGVDPAGRSYGECLPEVVGHDVLIEVQQYVRQGSEGDIGNNVGSLKGVS